MTFDVAGSVPPPHRRLTEQPPSPEHLSTVAGVVLSAAVAIHLADEVLVDTSLDDIVASVLAMTDAPPVTRLELDEVINRLVLAELVERQGSLITLGRLGRQGIRIGTLS